MILTLYAIPLELHHHNPSVYNHSTPPKFQPHSIFVIFTT